MSGRLIAIGDIHGHARALAALVRLIGLQPRDTLVTLGDYVGRGPDSKGVLDQLIALEGRCCSVPLMGNHEEMMLGAKGGRDDFKFWMQLGGDVALDSYGPGRCLSLVPAEHWAFLKRLPLYYESAAHFFMHANYYPNRPFPGQDSQTVLWRSLEDDSLPGRHYSGKTAIVGHSLQKDHKVLDIGHLICIDTGCGYGGLLTAMDTTSGRIWQVTEGGESLG